MNIAGQKRPEVSALMPICLVAGDWVKIVGFEIGIIRWHFISNCELIIGIIRKNGMEKNV